MQLKGLDFKGTTVTVGDVDWDLSTFELVSHKRDRQAKELTFAFRRAGSEGAAATEVDLVFCGLRCARITERDAPGSLVLEKVGFVRDEGEGRDPTDGHRTLSESAAEMLQGALVDMVPGECCRVAFQRVALDALVCADSARCDVRRTPSGSVPACDHSKTLRVYSKGDACKTVLPSGATEKGLLLAGCGDPEGLGCKVCLRCGHTKILEDVAPFDLRELNASVARAEAAFLKRKVCARCGEAAHGDVICETCGSVCRVAAGLGVRGEEPGTFGALHRTVFTTVRSESVEHVRHLATARRV